MAPLIVGLGMKEDEMSDTTKVHVPHSKPSVRPHQRRSGYYKFLAI